MSHFTIGQDITIRYSKDGTSSKEYSGIVENVTDKVVTVKTDKGFRSFKFEKIVMTAVC